MFIKSPIHYMGNKYDLLPYLFKYFPQDKSLTFYDLFGGSGCVSINVLNKYTRVVYNELEKPMCDLFKYVMFTPKDEIINNTNKSIKEFNLPTYNTGIAKIGAQERERVKKNYVKFREHYNTNGKRVEDLYTLSLFSFSHLIRFNFKYEFNVPFGNSYFSDTNIDSLEAISHININNLTIYNDSAFALMKNIHSGFVYADPPYAITNAIYNNKRTGTSGWGNEEDIKLCAMLDTLNERGVKFAMSNVLTHNGKTSNTLIEWINKNNYNVIHFRDKSYTCLGKGKSDSDEVLILNYTPNFEEYKSQDLF